MQSAQERVRSRKVNDVCDCNACETKCYGLTKGYATKIRRAFEGPNSTTN